MDFSSNAGDNRPDPKRRRSRRRRWYLLAVIPALLLTLAASGLFRRGICTMIGSYSGIALDLTPVLADAAMPVHVRACVRQRYSTLRSALPRPTSSCFSFPVDQRGLAFTVHGQASDLELDPWGLPDVFIKRPSLTWEPVAVRLTMRDQTGDSIFDSSAVVQTHKFEPNGPGCEPTLYSAKVVATRAELLAPYKVWQPNS